MVTGDFDADGHPDLAVVNYGSETVSVLLGRGDGTFQDTIFFGVGKDPAGVTVGDLDGFGSPDLAVTGSGDNSVTVLLNRKGPLVNTCSAGLGCLPAAGTLPFETRMTATLINHYAGCSRRIAARIDILLAGGQPVSRWRAGFANVMPDSSLQAGWATTLPALGTLAGENRFTIVAEDVTPYPYNAPPYPRAGDTGTGHCTVTGVAP